MIDADSNRIPDVAEAARPAPNTSDAYIVSQSQYDAAGRVWRSIDNVGRIDEARYDAAGRTLRTIQDFDGWSYGGLGSGFDAYGNVLETSTAEDITVDYQYDSVGRLVTMTCLRRQGSGQGRSGRGDQVSLHLAVNASWQTGVVYPDSTDSLAQTPTACGAL